MSFILDALKKSENERQQQSGGEFSSVPTSSAGARPARWIWLIAVLLAINVAVLLGILLRPDVRSTTTTALDDAALPPVPELEAPVGQALTTTPSFEQQLAQARQQQPAAAPATTTGQAPTETTSAPAAQPTPAPATSNADRIPTIEELRLDGSLQLPELHIDIHVYSEKPDDRFVFINMNKHREQSQLDEGPVVREITAEGVILQYQGRSFLLSRE